MRGEAREVGQQLASQVRAGVAIIGAGETTVTVRGSGRGGRNQELALGAVSHFAAPGVVASLGTDGADNGYVAGALVDERTPADGAEEHLARNDSTTFLRATRCHTRVQNTCCKCVHRNQCCRPISCHRSNCD
jgi:glycerate 2-kinase